MPARLASSLAFAGLVVTFVLAYFACSYLQYQSFLKSAENSMVEVHAQAARFEYDAEFLYANQFHGWSPCTVAVLLSHASDGEYLLEMHYLSSGASSRLEQALVATYPDFRSHRVDVTTDLQAGRLLSPRSYLVADGQDIDPAELRAESERLQDPMHLQRAIFGREPEVQASVLSPVLRQVISQLGLDDSHDVTELAIGVTALCLALAGIAVLGVTLPLLCIIVPRWLSRMPRWMWIVSIVAALVCGAFTVPVLVFGAPLVWLMLPAPRERYFHVTSIAIDLGAIALVAWPLLTTQKWWETTDASCRALWLAGNALQAIGLVLLYRHLCSGIREACSRQAALDHLRSSWRWRNAALWSCLLLGTGSTLVVGVFLCAPAPQMESETQVLVRFAGAIAACAGTLGLFLSVCCGGRRLLRDLPAEQPAVHAFIAVFPALILFPLVWVIGVAAAPR